MNPDAPNTAPSRAKPGTGTKKDQPEWGLSHWIDAFLDRVLLGEGWHTAVETGTWMPGASREQRMDAENKRRARGIKPHHLDWYCYQLSTGIYAQWELKVDGNEATPGQKDTIALLKQNRIPTTVCETVPEVCEFLIGAGFDLHGNARNIAIELHERYLAHRRATQKKPSRPRAASRSTFSVAQAHRWGIWK